MRLMYLCSAVLLSSLSACGKAPLNTVIEPTALVSIGVVELGDIASIVPSFGVVEYDPQFLHNINSEIEAHVTDLQVQAGSSVKKGQVLLKLKPSESAKIDMERARRDASTAQANAARVRRLKDDGLASNADIEQARSQAEDMKSLADSLQQRSNTLAEVRSPEDAIIESILVESGGIVSPGSPLLRLSIGPHLRARLNLEIEDAAVIELGSPVRLNGLDNSGLSIDSSLTAKDQRVDPATRMVTAYAELPPHSTLLSGQAVRAEITTLVHPEVPLIPVSSVFYDERGQYVFISENDTAVLRRVTTGITNKSTIEVTTGLTVGERIIVDAAAVLTDGMKTRLKDVLAEPQQ